jgi:hypothetical protein
MQPIDVPNSSPRRKRSRSGLWLTILAVVIGLIALWIWLTLAWSYSEGERAGIVQKFSRRGWLCKTYEGDLAQYVVVGVAPQIWLFSVRDLRVADQLNKVVGRKVQLHYTEHPGVPTSCFGDTRYYVDRITVVADEGR